MLRRVLTKFLNLDGVSAAMVITEDGIVVESIDKEGIDLESLGIPLSTILTSSSGIAEEMGEKEFSISFLELGSGLVMSVQLTEQTPISDVTYLTVIGKNNSNIGRIRYEMKKNKDLIVSVI